MLNLKEQTSTSLRERQPWAFVRQRKGLVILGVVIVVLLGLMARTLFRHSTHGHERPGFARDAGAQGANAGANGRAQNNGFTMPVAVSIATAAKGDIPVKLTELGTITPLATVTVKTQISGQLQKIAFTEGQMVKEGDFLAQIDPRPYQAALDQAVGTLNKDRALLSDARLDLKRYEELIKSDGIPQQTLDTQKATVDQDAGMVETDQANVEAAKVNLAYCHIVSPITGRVGLRQVDQGNYVTPGDATGIVVITQLQPISAVFIMPEDDISQVSKRLTTGATLPTTAFPKDCDAVCLNTPEKKLAEGRLLTIDNQIDVTTGTLKLRALFDNKDGALFPQQFVNVTLLVDTLHDQVLVPTSALKRGAPNGVLSEFVYVVDTKASTVSVRAVKSGVSDGDVTAMVRGLQAGDVVVTEGGDRLRDGANVVLPGAPPPKLPPSGRRGRNFRNNSNSSSNRGGGR